MLAYVAMHLANHAAGLISLAAMQAVLGWMLVLWGNPATQLLLYASLVGHAGLALEALWQQRALRWRSSAFWQLVLGCAIPLVLVRHIVGTRVAHDFFAADTSNYPHLLWTYFVNRPDRGAQQMAILAVAWTHAMVGLHLWLRVRPWYQRWQAPALAVAVLVPVLALLGAVEAGRQVAALAAAPGWTARVIAPHVPPPATAAVLDRIVDAATWGFIAAVVAVFLARIVRREWRRRRGLVRIAYPDGRAVDVVPGASVLEASRLAGIPHASVCGGRGRCSTCRVRVRAAPGAVDPPAEAEARVLRRIRATRNVRLACQLRPRDRVEVTPLLPPFAAAIDGRRAVDLGAGSERDLAILFADMRGFTSLAEGRLPYDVVFILNRYFAAMGRAVEAAGGQVDKFVGDGVMALFGLSGASGGGASGGGAGGSDAAAACRAALRAAALMAARLDELNTSLSDELEAPLRIGIGIHVGPTIVGQMGYGAAAAMTAIGDAVNTADRLQNLTKDFACQLVVSEEAAARAGVDLSAFPLHEIEVRGRRERLAVRTIDSAAALANLELA